MPSTTRILDANVNGTVYTSNANSALEAIDTCHSGTTAPTDEVANGKLWLDTTTTPGILKVYTNAMWAIVNSGEKVSKRSTYGGTANAITVTTGLGLTTLVTGMEIRFRATATNTGATTINVDGLGVVAASKARGGVMPAGYIRTDVDTVARYSGTDWVCSREVEFGSNANGKFTRWEDGRQVCYYNGTVNLVSLTYVRTYPAAFNELPAVWGHCVQQNLDGSASDARNIVYMTPHAGFGSGGHSATQWDMMAKATQSAATQCITTANIIVQFGAVGTWY
jgi:hypothetical protein